jgi:hypothetical protein
MPEASVMHGCDIVSRAHSFFDFNQQPPCMVNPFDPPENYEWESDVKPKPKPIEVRMRPNRRRRNKRH